MQARSVLDQIERVEVNRWLRILRVAELGYFGSSPTRVRRIPDGDLAAEVVYVQRELADDPGERKGDLRYCLLVL